MRFLLLLLLLLGSNAYAEDCSDYVVNKCTGDEAAEVMAFNTGSQKKCQAHCELFEDAQNCEFYAFHSLLTQGVDCHLYNEPVTAYFNHCGQRGGPRKEGADLNGPCLSPVPYSCEVAQKGDCTNYGQVVETLQNIPNEVACEQTCATVNEECLFWTWSREDKVCTHWDSAEMKCNVVFGPHSGTPEECGGGTNSTNRPDPDPVTPPPACPEVKCPAAGLALFPDCENCGRFYECFNGDLTSVECPYCNLYDEDKRVCNQPVTVDCGDRPKPNPNDCEPCSDPPPCLCPVGFFPDPLDCAAYAKCEGGGDFNYHSCNNATFTGLYNDELIQCDFPERVKCGDRPICRGPAQGEERSQCQCEGAAPMPPPDCSTTDGVFIMEDPYNCQHFLVCIGGALNQEVFCPAGQYVPSGGQECVAGDGSVCGGRPICNSIEDGQQCTCV